MSFPSFVLVEGVITGLGYGLLALGLVLIYRTNRVLNFAQGQLGVVAAVFMAKVADDWHINYWAALAAALLLAAGVGALCELTLRRIFNRQRVLVMVATIGLSQVLFLLTALPFVRPKKLSHPFPVPVDWTFSIGGFVFTPGQVLALVVAPVVALSVAAFVRYSRWGLALRAISENADSARLSGVWVRRTSTVAWTLAGVLSAFTAILNAPGQTSVLTEVLSPDLLVLALIAGLVGAMTNLTAAFVAGIGLGVVVEILNWNVTNPATVELILFGVLLVVLLVRVAGLQKGIRRIDRSSWLHGAAALTRRRDALRRRVGTSGVGAVVVVVALLPLVLSPGRSFLLAR